MPVDSPRYKAAKSAGDLYAEKLKAKHKNQAEVKQAVNEAQQIADTLKQSKQTVKTDNSYGEEVKTVKFKPMVLYIQNHIPKATNYESGEFTTGGYIVWAVCGILGFMLFVMFDKFVQWIKRKLKQCFKRS